MPDQPFIGTIMIFAGNYAPAGWAFCNGSLLSIQEYTSLFNLIGTTYGGDGLDTFAVPDLRGRIPLHKGQSPGGSFYILGQSGGVESVTINTQQLPAHSHSVISSNAAATTKDPGNNFLAAQPDLLEYIQGATANSQMKSNSTTVAGGSQPHNNVMPILGLNYVIALEGFYPSRN